MINQKGQLVLILILIITASLGVGVSVIQRNLSDISSSSKVEDSSRAFSAAEAGIERALVNNLSGISSTETGNNASATVSKDTLPPPGEALEHDPIDKDQVAQFWLVDPNTLNCSSPCVLPASVDIYWGNSDTEDAAIEVSIIYKQASAYKVQKYYFDSVTRVPPNGFDTSSSCTGGLPTGVSGGMTFQCKKTGITIPADSQMIRIRLLYSDIAQPVAVKPNSGSLPPQVDVITSIGTAGNTQRKVRVFKQDKVLPGFLDFALFSAGDISK